MTDTIVALSSGPPPSGVAVIRLSGPRTRALLESFAGGMPAPRILTLRKIGGLDRGLVAWFPGPHSFTGEDAAELQVHGSAAVVRGLLRTLTSLPEVRLAEPGEFTRRAFENGKLDLVEVEGLGDLLLAETENQRAIAYARLEGGLSRRIDAWCEQMLDLRAQLEAQLDFSDEGDVGELSDDFADSLDQLTADLSTAVAASNGGRILRSGFKVVLAGAPNSGKSSLLNALSQSEVAIVSDEPGTTRDLKDVPLDLGGQLVILTDSAGIRETSSDAEAQGVARAKDAMAAADLILWLEAPDAGIPALTALPNVSYAAPVLRLGSKMDIGSVAEADMSVSSKTGAGLPELLAAIKAAAVSSTQGAAETLVSHERDRVALVTARAALEEAGRNLARPEVAAELLREASHALERLLGRVDAEAVLDRLFLSFCIGK